MRNYFHFPFNSINENILLKLSYCDYNLYKASGNGAKIRLKLRTQFFNTEKSKFRYLTREKHVCTQFENFLDG